MGKEGGGEKARVVWVVLSCRLVWSRSGEHSSSPSGDPVGGPPDMGRFLASRCRPPTIPEKGVLDLERTKASQ